MIGAGALRGLASNALVVSDAMLPSMKATALFREGSGLNGSDFCPLHSVEVTLNSPKFVASKAALIFVDRVAAFTSTLSPVNAQL